MTTTSTAVTGERRFALVCALTVVILGTLPTLLALLSSPTGLTGFGTVMFVNDFAQYEAAMNEGVRGGSLLHDHFTPEQHAPAVMFPMYVALGKLAAVAKLDWQPLYRLMELLARLTVGGMLAAFVLHFADPTRRRIGVVLALFGAGLGFWAVFLQAAIGVENPYTGNASYEMNSYALQFGTPHAAFGMAITLGVVWLLLEAGSTWTPRRATLLVLGVVALGLLHPFNLVSVLLMAGALFALGLWERTGRRPRFQAGLLAAIAALPFLAYNALTFALDPFWGATYGAQNLLPSPTPIELIVDLGVLLLGLVGMVVAWQRGGAARGLTVVAAVALVAMYAPVPFQRRLGFGVTPFLAVLTTFALAEAARRWPGRYPLLACVVLVLALSTPLFIYGGMLASTRLNAPIPVYRATPELESARAWLAGQPGTDDVVLGSWDVSNYLGGKIVGRTAGGHPVATLHVNERRAELEGLFTDAQQQQSAIDREHAAYLVSTGPGEPIFDSARPVVFEQGALRIVRTQP